MAKNKLNAGDALDALAEKTSEAELRGEVHRLRSASTRDKPLHGHIDDLKAPY